MVCNAESTVEAIPGRQKCTRLTKTDWLFTTHAVTKCLKRIERKKWIEL